MLYSNIRYEFQSFEDILNSIDNEWQWPETANDHQSFSTEVNREVLRIKSTFVSEVFSFQNERHLERYIQYHQQTLIRLMDETLRKTNNAQYLILARLQTLYKGLEELLFFIEQHFSKYFDQDSKAPTFYVSILRDDMQIFLKEISRRLFDLNVEQQLADALLYAISRLCDEEDEQVTSYRSIIFVKQVHKELLNLLSSLQADSDVNDEIRNLMYYLNYNSNKTFSYHANHINKLLNAADTRHDMIESMSLILKRVNQAQVRPGIGYDIHAPTLKEQLTYYIIEEIEHLNRIHNLGQTNTVSSPGSITSFKLQTEMSVAQIAYLIKILVETHIITNHNIAELLRFLSKFFVSKKTATISYDSLRSKYYNAEQGTRQSVKGMLLKLAYSIDQIA
jgi:hypothetical protein